MSEAKASSSPSRAHRCLTSFPSFPFGVVTERRANSKQPEALLMLKILKHMKGETP